MFDGAIAAGPTPMEKTRGPTPMADGPWTGGYAHCEGNTAAHVKASMMGSSCQVIVEGGRLHLGTWQSIYFCEFDGPRSRKVWVSG